MAGGATGSNQYGDIMILPNIQQVSSQNPNSTLPSSKDQNSRQNHGGSSDNKGAGGLIHQSGVNRHK